METKETEMLDQTKNLYDRSVSLKELNDWIKENAHLTWLMTAGGPFSKEGREKGGAPYVKYIYPSFDTRTMSIFHIKTDRFEVDFRDEFDGNILQQLSQEINKWRNK